MNRLHIILILTVLGLLAYANAVYHPFVHDDVVFIEKNPYIGDLNLGNIFFQTSIPDEKVPLVNKYYRPLLELVNRVLHRIVGLNPHGFHFFNILLHIVNSFLVYMLACFMMGGKKIPSLAIALLFLLHPIQSEAVACISGISNLVFAFLCLASFCTYLTAMHSQEKGKGLPLYGASLMLFLFALLAKEQSVILPFLIMAYELCFMDGPLKKTIKEYWRPIVGFFIVLGGYFFLRKMLFGSALTPIIDSDGEIWVRMLAIPRSLLVYLGLIFFPHDLYYYRSQDILLPFVWPLTGIVVIVLAVFWLTWRMPKAQRNKMIFGLCWFFIALLPTLNIIPMINEYSKVLTAEHFLYFPLIGLLLFIIEPIRCWVMKEKEGRRFAVSFISFVALIFFFTGFTAKQNTYWRGEIPLFERTLYYEKDFGRVRLLLAKAYSAEGRFEEAIAESQKALTIMQGYEQKVQKKEVKQFYLNFIEGIRYHLGYCFDALGDVEGALAEFEEVLRLKPDNKIIHDTLGIAYLKVQDVHNAIVHFEKALVLNPDDLFAMNSLAICYQEVGEDAKAEGLLRAIVEKDSSSVSAQQNLKELLKKRSLDPAGVKINLGE